ncbi:MAG: hypothetical protein HYX78_15445 [Armatimonadetes bacterium]|nr:hypothetical protein [Armatimonadota bacterium]
MPIPFKTLSDDEPPGTAGYLKFMPRAVGDTWLGALFVIDAAGEPVEFSHARIEAPKPLLWRREDLQSHCLRALCASMFDICPVSPLVILCLAEEVDHRLFSEHIRIDIPLARVSPADGAIKPSTIESLENTPESGEQPELSIYWTGMPEAQTSSRQLFDVLAARGLLLEPFQRAETGLREVYTDLFNQ